MNIPKSLRAGSTWTWREDSLVDPYGDQEEDSWNNLDDCISDLSYYMGVAV